MFGKHMLFLIVTFVCFLVLATVQFGAKAALAKGVYESLEVPDVLGNEVNELGATVASFIGGGLEKGDFAIFRLPPGFIWTTADLGSGKSDALAAYQTTDQWNTTEFTDDYAKYGTSNYVLVPRKHSGNDNGLFKGAAPGLNFTGLSDREVVIRIIDDPIPFQDCYFYLYANRVFVDGDYNGNVSLEIDAMPGSVFSSQESTVNTVECTSVPAIYACLPEQKIGSVVIKEVAAGRLGNGQTLTLQLPGGARWLKLAEDSANGLGIKGSIIDNGRTAEFTFKGLSTSAAVLELKNMEVAVDAGMTGNLKIRAGGSAGLSGEFTVAEIVNPAAVFAVGKDEFEIGGAKNIMDVAPYIRGDRVYLPVRYIAGAVGVADDDIVWKQDDRSIEIRKAGRVVNLEIGSNMMYVDNTPVRMDCAPEIIAPGRVMLPLRWVAEALGCDIYWDETAQSAFVLGQDDR